MQHQQEHNLDYKDIKGITQFVKRGWGILRGKRLITAFITLLITFVPSLLDQMLQVSFFGSVIGLVANAGLIKFYLNIVKGQPLNIKDLWWHFNSPSVFFKSILLYIAYILLCLVGFLFCIIPGFYFLYTYLPIFYIFVEDPKKQFLDIFNESSKLMRNRVCDLFMLVFILGLLLVVGLLCLIVGVFFIIPVANTSIAIFYLHLKANAEIQPINNQSIESDSQM